MTGSSPRTIHLDTSFLIRALVADSAENGVLRSWLSGGRIPEMSTLAWGEFLCGPLQERGGPLEARVEEIARRVVRRHVPVGVDEATEAARLFRLTGRRRGSFADCVIAATALGGGAVLATSDRAHFERFAEAGLEMAE